MWKLGIIIQARMGSTRLPGKILKKIGKKTLLGHIFYRFKTLRHTADIVLATSTLPQNNIVEEFGHARGITCFRGSEDNVMERYYLCAKKCGFDHIVRVTADNPFLDIEELDRLIDLHLETKSDFSNSFQVLPIGVGLEIFSFAALEKSFYEGKESHHIEHVNEYILEHPEIFKTSLLQVTAGKNHPEIRLTVDTEEDYHRACYIVEHCPNEYISTEEAISLCLQYV